MRHRPARAGRGQHRGLRHRRAAAAARGQAEDRRGAADHRRCRTRSRRARRWRSSARSIAQRRPPRSCSIASRCRQGRRATSTRSRAASGSASRSRSPSSTGPSSSSSTSRRPGLDPQSRRELHDEILRMKHDGHTVLLTTHYLDEAEALCDRIADHPSRRDRRDRHAARADRRDRPRVRLSVSSTTARPIARDWLRASPASRICAARDERRRFDTAVTRRPSPASMRVLDARGIDITELHVRRPRSRTCSSS